MIESLVNKYTGKARHSDLMNMSHMKKREFTECEESLIEREAISVEAFGCETEHRKTRRGCICWPGVVLEFKALAKVC